VVEVVEEEEANLAELELVTEVEENCSCCCRLSRLYTHQ